MNEFLPARPARRALPLLVVLAVLASATGSAQTPDTTAAWRYLPLAVGNEWHYVRTSQGDTPSVSGRSRYRVVAFDATPPAAFVVDVYIRTVTNGTPAEITRTERWQYNPATRRVDGPAGDVGRVASICPLDAPFRIGVNCGSTTFGVDGGYARSVVIGSDTVTTSRKTYGYAYSTGQQYNSFETEYGAGIGETSYLNVSRGPAINNYTTLRVLQYARIGDQEYGQRLFPSAGEAVPTAGALTLSVGPNPSSHTVTLRYTLAAPGTVRLILFDMLGREVAVLSESEGDAGANEVRLDVGRLAPGLYLVRLESGSQTLSRRLTIAQ